MIYLNLPHVTLTLLYQKRTMSQPKINTLGDLCTCCKQNVAYFQHQQDYGGTHFELHFECYK